MPPRRRDHSLGFGVYFAPEDYIGLGRRLAIFAIDGAVLSLILLGLAGGAALAHGERWLPLLMLGAAWTYEVPLKRSDLRTVGYRLMNCRLVTLQGTRPSLLALTFRGLLWMTGPGNFVLDLIWCGVDPDRQTLRDRFASVCLVRNSAQPIGQGPIHLAHYTTMGYYLPLPRVIPPPSAASK